jgi:hypothetical protein
VNGGYPSGLTRTLDLLATLDWSTPAEAHARASAIFASIDVRALLDDLGSGLARTVDVERSVEKTTHYKWFVAEDRAAGYQLWLHDYKPRTHRRQGHAAVAHNHRFWLTSLILRGGFTDNRFRRASVAGDGERTGIERIGSRRMQSGDTMVLEPDDIHALSELQDGTLSLIAQGHPVRNYSEVFEDGVVRRYPDLGAKLHELRHSL